MNPHPRDEELIDHAFGLLDDPARLDQHLAQCGECRTRQAALRERLDQLSLLQHPVEAPELLITDTLRRVRMAGPAPARAWSRWLIPGAAAAAAAVALVAFPFLTRHSEPPRTPAPEAPAAFEVTLAPPTRTLDVLEPLPAEAPAMPVALNTEVEVATDAESPASVGTDYRAEADLARPTDAPTGMPPALRRMDARALAKKEAAVLGDGLKTKPAAVAAAKPAPSGRSLILPAAATTSPGPAVILYPVADADFSGYLGPEKEVSVEQRGDQLSLVNTSTRSVTVRWAARDGKSSALRLAPGSRTNIFLKAASP